MRVIKLIILCLFIISIFSMTDIAAKAIAINLVCNPTKENIDSYNVNDNGKIVNVPAMVDPATGGKKLKYPVQLRPGAVNVYKAQAVTGTMVSAWSNPVAYDLSEKPPAGCAMIQ